jgi:hypothetical protein
VYKFKRTTDIEIIESVLLDDEMFGRITESGTNKKDIQIDISDSNYYAALFYNETLLGIALLHPESITTGIIHMHILKQHRKQHAEHCGMLCLKMMLDTNHIKFNAQIPQCYIDVCKFTEKMGFVKEGINRSSVFKNGTIMDTIYYGCTRNEMLQRYNELKVLMKWEV